MTARITATLHHLVGTLDGFADDFLRRHHGVSFATFHFLAAAADVEPVDITTLARCLGVTKAAVSKRVPGLVADGWITTTTGSGQGRRVLISLAPRARELVHAAGGELEAAFTELFTDPRLAAQSIDVDALRAQLDLLITLVQEKGPLS
ncbi:MarR family winged helix-turn-helix transcriptional regulator [Microbacterium terricola]|uniref:HTH marR-type domain-containing protein n=1 Tax=Microbacterium terricola TaxID=344163 RepID=A0ABM8DWF6_9MICO|nr:MarR family transcriptional regulator [Microbacterium terricola]UYK39326.1 MarR family transcriptional regulator [Microbacterium terricola]BDV29951.1 hypothetical protein Microterr_06110 [Microbacterium terricola]